MKKELILSLLFLFTTSLSFVSCGGGKDGDKGDTVIVNNNPNGPENEENGGGGTGGGRGSGGTTTRPAPGCLTSTGQNSVINLLNSLTNKSPILGTTKAFVTNDDGSISTGAFPATGFSFRRTSGTTWGVTYAVCNSVSCETSSATYAIEGGCFFVDGARVGSVSTGISSLSFSFSRNGDRLQVGMNNRGSQFGYAENYSRNGVRFLRLTFLEQGTSSTLARNGADPQMNQSMIDALKPVGNEPTSIREVLPLEDI